MRKFLAATAVVGLAVLLYVDFNYRFNWQSDYCWLFHGAAGICVAMFWGNFWFFDLTGWRCLPAVFGAATGWELYEYWLEQPIPFESVLDVMWTLVGGVIYNVVYFLLVRWRVGKG